VDVRRVNLHIDRVVLRGVRIDDPRAFTTELKAELARAIEILPALACTHGVDRKARAAQFPSPVRASSAGTGRNLARAIAGVLAS